MENNTENKKIKKLSETGGFITGSLRNQILIPFLILIILTGGVVAFVSYHSSVNNTTEALTENVESQMVGMNDTFEMFFSNINNTVERLTSNELVLNYEPDNRLDLLQYFGDTQENETQIANIYTAIDQTGEVIIYPTADLVSNFDAREREWYQNAAESSGKTVWSSPYTDESTGETVVTAAQAYYNGDELAGVVGVDVMIGTLTDMISQVEIGETGYGVIFDQSGQFLAHPDPESIGGDQSEEIYQKIINTGEQGMVEYQSEGQDKIMTFIQNPTTGWTIGGTVNVQDFQKQAQSIILPISIALAVMFLIAIIVSIMVARGVTKPVQQVMERMKKIASGDLSGKPLEVKTKNEIGQLVDAANDMNQNMREVLHHMNEVSETVSSQSEELTQSATEVKTGSEQIASTMEELAAGAETQANSASDLSSAMGSFSERVEEANQKGEHIWSNSGNVLDMTTKGSRLMHASTEQMHRIEDIVKEAEEKMQRLDNQSQEISKLVAVIKDVAAQTNLLALNAAIEAARAGENGKGFAVVADEVRKLAEQVAVSVDDITGIVSNIQTESTNVANSLKDGYTEVEQGSAQLMTTNETFHEINSAVTEMAQSIQVVSDNLSEIAAANQEMNGSIENIASVSEEAAAGVEQTTASTQQTSSSMEEVAGSSEDLAKLAEELHEIVRRFKL